MLLPEMFFKMVGISHKRTALYHLLFVLISAASSYLYTQNSNFLTILQKLSKKNTPAQFGGCDEK